MPKAPKKKQVATLWIGNPTGRAKCEFIGTITGDCGPYGLFADTLENLFANNAPTPETLRVAASFFGDKFDGWTPACDGWVLQSKRVFSADWTYILYQGGCWVCHQTKNYIWLMDCQEVEGLLFDEKKPFVCFDYNENRLYRQALPSFDEKDGLNERIEAAQELPDNPKEEPKQETQPKKSKASSKPKTKKKTKASSKPKTTKKTKVVETVETPNGPETTETKTIEFEQGGKKGKVTAKKKKVQPKKTKASSKPKQEPKRLVETFKEEPQEPKSLIPVAKDKNWPTDKLDFEPCPDHTDEFIDKIDVAESLEAIQSLKEVGNATIGELSKLWGITRRFVITELEELAEMADVEGYHVPFCKVKEEADDIIVWHGTAPKRRGMPMPRFEAPKQEEEPDTPAQASLF